MANATNPTLTPVKEAEDVVVEVPVVEEVELVEPPVVVILKEVNATSIGPPLGLSILTHVLADVYHPPLLHCVQSGLLQFLETE